MLTAAVYGLLASSSFVIGVVIAFLFQPPRRVIAGVLAFGSGVLVSALTFDLVDEAAATGSIPYVVAGLLVGAAIYVGMSTLLDRLAARSPKRTGRQPGDVEPGAQRLQETPEQAAINGTALLFGAVLDGIPENLAIGIGLSHEGSELGLVLLAAVFLGNLPESISSTAGMQAEGRSRGYIILVWSAAALCCTLATVAGYALLGGLSDNLVSAVLALAAGGILAMLADTMMPEAFETGGPLVAMATAIGFACAISLAQLTG